MEWVRATDLEGSVILDDLQHLVHIAGLKAASRLDVLPHCALGTQRYTNTTCPG